MRLGVYAHDRSGACVTRLRANYRSHGALPNISNIGGVAMR